MMAFGALLQRALPGNRFLRRVSVLFGATLISQLIMVVAAPLLTRFYSPEDFGLLAVFVALLSLLTVLAALRYEQAIPLPEDDGEAAALLLLSLLSILLVCLLVAVPLVIYRSEIAVLLNAPRLGAHLYLVPLGAMLAAVYTTLNLWALRMKDFVPIAKTKVGQSVVAVAIQLVGAPLGAVALLTGQIAGQGAGFLSLGLRSLWPRRAVLRSVSCRQLLAVASKYRKFPIFSTWSAVFNTAGSQLPAILFAVLFSPAAAGMYILAARVLSIPMQFLGQAIGNVFYADAVDAHRQRTLPVLVARIHSRLAHVGMPPMLILVFAGPDIFSLVFGSQWREAGIFAQWLAPWLYLVFITAPLSAVVLVLDRQGTSMLFQAILLAVRVLAIAVGASMNDFPLTVMLFAVGSMCCWIGNLVWLMRISGNGPSIARHTGGAVAWGMLLASPVMANAAWSAGHTQWMLSVSAAFLLITGRYAYLMKKAWS